MGPRLRGDDEVLIILSLVILMHINDLVEVNQ
jgi:hypothetical protein